MQFASTGALDTTTMNLTRFTLLAAVSFTSLVDTLPAFAQEEPDQVVARVKLSSPSNEENPVFAEAGDILMVLNVKDKVVLVQSAEGRRANVREQDVVELTQSKPLYDQLIKETPNNPALYSSRAMVYSILNDQQQVIADLNMAMRLGSKTPSVYINRGAAYATLGEYEKAVADYSAAIKAGYDHPSVFVNRAVTYMAQGEAKKSSDDLTVALKKDPKNEFALMQRGIAYQRQQLWDQAIADFTTLFEMNEKNIEAISSRGFTHYLKGDGKNAVADFTTAIKINPESALAYNNRGFNRQTIGQYKEALADFNKAIELEPKYAMAFQNKAWLLATCPDEKIRDGKLAIEAATAAGELREWKVIPDLKSLAAAYAEVGDFKKAVEWQKKVVGMIENEEAKSGEQELLKLYQNKAPFRFAPPPAE